ncbi:molybdopterin-guanine dinucleotide biosynthesis protein [Arachnia propionica]|uniref:Molybdopterin-guanine dinucleotide biosynthesis protein n=1 Tax=Arachnia propionica TaxID=1750 RepID=A0A3P1T1V2_9ACTN|nr:NTP transferase domain-containing protein [Arachnia propionica]RRD03477.1 molybdopterin-guanine dinucleotide biosynthesis protein [Arachnia propionica]
MAEQRLGIVLGGGRSSRMGTDKLELTVSGRTLLQRVVEAALWGCHRVLVVSPSREGFEDPRVRFVLEEPPYGGPAAGLAAAVTDVSWADGATEVMVLAGDLASPDVTVSCLLDGDLDADGVVLVDEEGWPQHLAARYRLAALRAAVVEARGECRGMSVKRLLTRLNLAMKNVPKLATVDLDTPDLARIHGVDGEFSP